MQDLQKIRFLTVNFSNLQTLRAVPFGMLLLAVVYWAGAQLGPARNFTVPIVAGLAAVCLYWLVDRYYRLSYGRVQRAREQGTSELVIGIAGGLLGLAAILVDFTRSLSLSLVGVVFALAFPVEYLRIFRLAPGGFYLWQALTSGLVVLAADLLPIFGLQGWQQAIGLRSHLLGVLAVAGVMVVVSGLLGHAWLNRQLPRQEV